MPPTRPSLALCLFVFLFALTGCITLDENAVLTAPSSASFKEGGHDGVTPPNQWWTLFHSEELNSYAARIDSENFALQAGLARIEQACAILGVSRAELVPNSSGSGSVQRNRSSENDSVGGFFNVYSTQYRGALALSWEIDLWGRVRSAVRGARSDVEQVRALTEDLRLSLKSQLAPELLHPAIRRRGDSRVTQGRDHEGGQPGPGEKTVRGRSHQRTGCGPGRNGVGLDARGVGTTGTARGPSWSMPSPFLSAKSPRISRSASSPLDFRLPRIRAGVPMEVLQNRPDVAAAIARLSAANARIGVARAEFFPRIDLISAGGLSSIDSSRFFDWSSRTFAVGPEVTLPLFQGGRLRAISRGPALPRPKRWLTTSRSSSIRFGKSRMRSPI